MTNRILIVEDEELLRAMYKESVARVSPESQVTEARNGVTGMELILTNSYDLLITDDKHVGPDGIELIRTAMSSEHKPHVIFSSGDHALGSQLYSIAPEAVYLKKPFSFKELDGTLAKLLK